MISFDLNEFGHYFSIVGAYFDFELSATLIKVSFPFISIVISRPCKVVSTSPPPFEFVLVISRGHCMSVNVKRFTEIEM